MKRAIFILLVLALLTFTACSSGPTEPINQEGPGPSPGEAIAEDIDTSGMDSLEQDISTIDQSW